MKGHVGKKVLWGVSKTLENKTHHEVKTKKLSLCRLTLLEDSWLQDDNRPTQGGFFRGQRLTQTEDLGEQGGIHCLY